MGEYISREALMRDLRESLIFSVRDGVIGGEIRGANKVIDRIKAAPAADVVEVRHGEWIADYDSGSVVLQCNLCGEKYWLTEDEYEKGESPNYCPNCGAKMNGGRK